MFLCIVEVSQKGAEGHVSSSTVENQKSVKMASCQDDSGIMCANLTHAEGCVRCS